MALRPTKQHVPVLSKEEVIRLRELYYNKGYSLRDLDIELDFQYSPSVIRRAVKGIGRFYSGIEDGIPKECR